MKNTVLNQNKQSWDKVAHHFNGIDALPSYGPYAQTEEELHLFDEVENAKVLEIGYGSGHSLRYMANRGASELWGVDLSEEQRRTAETTLAGLSANLFCAPMEEEIQLPKNYFDHVYSIYAIGWTTDLKKTFELIYSYLKKGGSFIFSWDHPLYMHLKSENGEIKLNDSYQMEGLHTFENFKGEGVSLTLHKRKMATYINELIQGGFTIQEMIESDVSERYQEEESAISDRYYSLYKARKFPTTMIMKAVK
ncbi:class I SAM-dependent methyltransferase [Bacillus sp. RAR_GA_16]|uniref:class I SAM-dependent methyltransferase n=1 Tax=Bacillus sp. RAR_GA_16 TaxID=2876774 RepID=UPI001CCA1485|nr:class I SAM-dependent methyltransferase [Bacillus sp. RAR_GA_16]MCA0172512.1 class I SAM-dependent methyltransferase [Bacillus sp. RAR_GA_16]